MPDQTTYLTKEGLEKLEAELNHLRTVRRQEVANRIHEAKELASTVNNAEFDDAKNEQAWVEGRILTLENLIRNAKIIEIGHPSEYVRVGSIVRAQEQSGKFIEYTIVGSTEASPRDGRISNESPVGRALLGHRIGDEVQVLVPAGALKLTIVGIR